MKAIFIGGKYNNHTFDSNALADLPDFTGHFTKNFSYERMYGGIVPCKELDNQPIINGYMKPMFDNGMLRYESIESYGFYSM